MLFIEYPKCSTCQKAKRWLDENGIAYTDRHIKEQNPTYAELKAWYEKSGLPLKKFFNTSGMLYKSMGLKEKLPQMSEEEQLQLLATDGMLVKRPVVVTDSCVLTGFREKESGTVPAVRFHFIFDWVSGFLRFLPRRLFLRLRQPRLQRCP